MHEEAISSEGTNEIRKGGVGSIFKQENLVRGHVVIVFQACRDGRIQHDLDGGIRVFLLCS